MEKYNIVFILKFFFRYKNEIHSHIVKVVVRNRRKKKNIFLFFLMYKKAMKIYCSEKFVKKM